MSRMQSIWEQRTERKRGREKGTLVAAAACALGALYRFPAIYPPLFHLSSFSLSTATGIQNCNTRICCHWNSSLFPVTSEWKFPLHFTKCRRKEREKSRRTGNFIYLYFIFISLFSRIKISVKVDKQNTYGSEYLVWLLECKKSLNIFIHSCNKNFIFVGMQKSFSQY